MQARFATTYACREAHIRVQKALNPHSGRPKLEHDVEDYARWRNGGAAFISSVYSRISKIRQQRWIVRAHAKYRCRISTGTPKSSLV